MAAGDPRARQALIESNLRLVVAMARRYQELGYRVEGAELDETYKRFTALADRKKHIYDRDLVSLLPQRGARPTPPMGQTAPAFGD